MYIFSILGGNNTEVDMVDSTQMEKFEFDKSNQTYLGKDNNNNNNNFDKSNQTCLGKKQKQ